MFRFHRADLRFGFAASASVVIAVLLGVVYAWGGGTGSGAFGFVLTGLAFAATPSLSSTRAVTFGLVGGLLTLLAFVVSGQPGWSAVALGVVAGIAALATMRSSGVSVNWSLLAVWTLVALLIVEEGAELEAAIAFVVGSAIALGLAALLRRDTDVTTVASESLESMQLSAVRFAVGKGLAVALGVMVGFWWFPDVPYWVALTVLIVAQPDRWATVRVAVARSFGTLLGVLAGGLALFVTAGGALWTAISIVGLVFCQMLFLKVNYVLYTLFLTAVVVVAASFTTADVGGVGWSRIIATVMGAVLAILLTRLMTDSEAQPFGK